MTDPITLKWTTWSPPEGAFPSIYTWWMDEIEKRTEGHVRFEKYWAETLVPVAETLDETSKGVVDVATFASIYTSDAMPLSDVISLPGVVTDLWSAMKATMEIAQLSTLRCEAHAQNVQHIATFGGGSMHLVTRVPVRELADLRGLKIIAISGEFVQIAQALGATPVHLVETEWVDALSKGAVDGGITSVAGAALYQFHEIPDYRYMTLIDLGGYTGQVVCNLDSWHRLPPSAQRVVAEVSDELIPRYVERFAEEDRSWLEDKFLAAGGEVFPLSDADKMQLRELAIEPVWEQWISANEDQGPAREVLQEWRRLNETWRSQSPFVR